MNKKRGPGLFAALVVILTAHWLIQMFERWLGLPLQ